MIKKLKQYFSKKETKQDAKFTHHIIGGHKFRTIDDFGSNLYDRYVAFLASLKNVDIGINKEDLLSMFDKQKAAFDAGDFTGAAAINRVMDARVRTYDQTKLVWQVANAFTLLEGEDETKITAAFTDKKLKLCKENKEIEFFFINNGLHQLKAINNSLANLSPEDFLSKENKAIEELSTKIIGSMNSSKSSTTPTTS